MYPIVLLLGGFGTRLKSISNDTPKALMKVGNAVFLDKILEKVVSHNINHIYLSTYYKSNLFSQYINDSIYKDKLSIIKEPEPLGTGGAVKFLLANSSITSPFFVVNGDSVSNINLEEFQIYFKKSNYKGLIGLSHLRNAERYGSAILMNGKIIGFQEKLNKGPSWINNGYYILQKEFFSVEKNIFSLEKDLLPKLINTKSLGIFKVYNDNFIDIGVPEDYLNFCKRYKSNA